MGTSLHLGFDQFMKTAIAQLCERALKAGQDN